MSMGSAALTGSGHQHRAARGGRRKQEHTRCERLVGACYPEDKRDVQVLCDAWDVPESTLVWAVVHDWLQRERGVSSQLGEVRGRLKMAIELGLRDVELRPWLLAQIAEGER